MTYKSYNVKNDKAIPFENLTEEERKELVFNLIIRMAVVVGYVAGVNDNEKRTEKMLYDVDAII